MRYFVFIFLLIILPFHSNLSAAMEYRHTFASSGDGSGNQAEVSGVSGENGLALAPDIDLDHDGDFFDAMFFVVVSLPGVTPMRQSVASVEQSIPLQQSAIFSNRPERPQWPLAV
jgi:hypothetical protein